MGSQLIKLEKKYFARGQYNVVLLISAMNVFKQNKKRERELIHVDVALSHIHENISVGIQ